MTPTLDINYIAVFFAALAQFLLGSLWYGPFFGKPWKEIVGLPATMPAKALMTRNLTFAFLGAFLTSFVLANQIYIWFPETWGIQVESTASCFLAGSQTALFVWIGYYVPLMVSSILWENKSWALFGINGLYYLLSLQMAGAIISCWR